MEEQCVSAVRSWPIPNSGKAVQRFLGFANYFWRFIQGISTVVALLSFLLVALLRGGHQRLHWTETERPFETLKARFTNVPVLAYPNPSLHHRGGFLQSRSQSCAVPAHQNPSKAVTLRLLLQAAEPRPEELRHRGPGTLGSHEFSEGMEALAKHPFLVWMDHCNLEYIRAVKRLNPRQARCALFFARFQFMLSYRPGSRNVKADALSRLYDAEEREGEKTPIIPPSRIIAPVMW